MSLTEIYDAFRRAADSGGLAGDDPHGMEELLKTLGISSLEITGGQVQQDQGVVQLTATTKTTKVLHAQWSVTLTGRETRGSPTRASLDLKLEAISKDAVLSLQTAFPNLPQSRVQVPFDESGVGGGLVLGNSLLYGLSVTQSVVLADNRPVGTARPIAPKCRLQGWLVIPTGHDLRTKYDWLLGTDPLWLDGWLEYPTVEGAPTLRLEAAIPGLSFDVPGLTLSSAGLRLVNDYPDPVPFPQEGAPLSAVLLFGWFTLHVPEEKTIAMTVPLSMGDFVWPFRFSFDEGGLKISSAGRLLASLIGADASEFSLPPGIQALDLFQISALEFGYVPDPTGTGPGSLRYSSVTIESSSRWVPPVPFVVIDRVGVTWVFTWGGDDTLVTASVWGTMTFGEEATDPLPDATANSETTSAQITVRLDLPDYVITAYNEAPFTISFSDALKSYFGSASALSHPGEDGPEDGLTVTDVGVTAWLDDQVYQGVLAVEGKMTVDCSSVTFGLESLQLIVTVASGSVSGLLAGTASVTIPNKDDVKLRSQAEYSPDKTWVFQGGLAGGALDLVDLVAAFFSNGKDVPEWVSSFSVKVTDFWVRYSTATDKPYLVRGKVVISLTVVSTTLSLEAEASVERRSGSNGIELVGDLQASFTVNGLVITAGMSFADKKKAYMFSVAFAGKALTATTRSVEKPTHDVLTLRLTGLTLGDVVGALVHLANPNASYRLDPPWDFLYSIDLGRASLEIDQTLQKVTLSYQFDLSLPFLSLKTIGLVYDRSSGTPTVRWALEGAFLGEQEQTMEWDAVNESPPPVPGKGQRLFDLKYLALGQHVSPPHLTEFTSISEVLAEMRKTMGEIDPSKPDQLDKLGFDSTSGWLVGLDCTVMDTVDVQLVLHDPDLYGILVSLHGADAGSLAGLSAELLYKKVTSDVGVFHARLQVPDAFRSFQLGAVSVTLGIITVDVYTNGNFLVDLGFPHDRVFDNSFAVEAGIFNGRGGIYFGVLSGATSSKVPAITNGVFSPVIVLGIGLEVGVGRSIEKGPLKAGFQVDLVTVVEGVLAWFHPSDAGSSVATYYWCRGTVGIVGKLYGSIDFKIVAASISVEAHAFATITFAAYEKTLVELDVGVTVDASITILGITVSFHFDITLQASFEIGASSQPPWALASGSTDGARTVLAGRSHAPSRRRPSDVIATTRHAYRTARFRGGSDRVEVARQGSESGFHLSFDKDVRVFPGEEIRQTTLKLTPAFTRDAVPVDWSGVPPPPSGEYRIAFLLVADSAVPASAQTIAEARNADISMNAHAATPADTTFQQIAEAMLRWSIDALGIHGPTEKVALGDLEELVDQLSFPDAAYAGFSWENLDGFLTNNLHFVVSAWPYREASSVSGVQFPMMPGLKWTTSDSEQDRDFSEFQPVDATYEREALEYFTRLDPRREPDRPDPEERFAAGAGAVPESMARFVARDYFLMTARTVAQAAVDLLGQFPHVVTTSDSLDAIAKGFSPIFIDYVKRAGDTIEEVAQHFGMSAAEVRYLDPDFKKRFDDAKPGATLAVPLGVTPGSIAAANPAWGVEAGKTVQLQSLTVAVQLGDTLSKLATRYGTTATDWVTPSHEVFDTPGLLREHTTLRLPSFTYANPTELTVEQVAAAFFVRLPVAARVTHFDWYEQAISQLNELPADDPFPAEIKLPVAYLDATPGGTWKTLPGDTLRDVAAYTALLQNKNADAAFVAWLVLVKNLNTRDTTGPIMLPAHDVTIEPGDTLESLRARLLISDNESQRLADFVRIAGAADVLVALATVVVDEAKGTTSNGQTLVDLAQAYGVSLEDLGMRMFKDQGVLSTHATKTLTLPAVPAIPLSDLVSALHLPTPASTIGGQVSRYMLHGLRLPAPEPDPDPDPKKNVYHATGPMTGMYELVGQQLTGPGPDGTTDPALTLTVTKGEPAAWLTLATAATASSSDTLEALTARHPALVDLNPALELRAISGRVPPGMVLLTEQAQSIVIEITHDDVTKYYPAGTLDRTGDVAEVMQLWRDVDVRHPLTQVVPWQTTTAPLLPSGVPVTAETFSLWMMPRDLLTIAAQEPTVPYRLLQTAPQSGPSAAPVEVSAYAWATLVRFGVRTIPGSVRTIEVLGADTADRHRLLGVVEYLRRTQPSTDQGHLRLLWQLPASPGATPGLVSTALDAAQTFLVKTNLSTETRSGPRGARSLGADASVPYFASMADPDVVSFLTLLWECSVVGGGGYWLNYSDPGIPDTIFDQDGYAQLTLLVQLDSQSKKSGLDGPARTLLAANNCAVVGGGVDPATVSLWAEALNHAETERKSTVPPGQVGFVLDLSKPEAATDEKQRAIQALYSLVGYRLLETTAFWGSNEGRPLGPQTPRGTNAGQDDSWRLIRTIPIASFAQNLLPKVDFLPLSTIDPYAGINGGSGPDGYAVAITAVDVWFHDILGNSTQQSSGQPLAVPVTYTDPLLGPGSWPSTVTSFDVTSGVPGGADLFVRAALQAIEYQPRADESGDEAAARALSHKDRFDAVYYQIHQPDVTAVVLTTLRQPPGGAPEELPVPIGSLRDFVSGTCVFLGSVASFETFELPPSSTAITLEGARSQYGVTYPSLGTANADLELAATLGAASLKVPEIELSWLGDSVKAICKRADKGDPVSVLKDEDNIVLPLMPRTELRIPPTNHKVTSAALTVTELLGSLNCALASFVTANKGTTDLLTPGFVFEANGVLVGVASEGTPESATTLELVADTFATKGVAIDARQVVERNADKPGMFRAEATVQVTGYLARPGDTLEENHSGYGVSELAGLNSETVNLFPVGTPLVLGVSATDVSEGATLRQFAATAGVSPGDILRHNGTMELPPASTLVVPGLMKWPSEKSSVLVPYSLSDDNDLSTLVKLFLPAIGEPGDSPQLALARLNRRMPGLVAPDREITIGGASVPTEAGDSINVVIARFEGSGHSVSLAELVDAIQDTPGVLASGALLLCPPGHVLAAHTASGAMVKDVARQYGARMSPVDLLGANAGMPDLLVAGQTLKASAAATDDEVVITASHDTVTAIIARFGARGITTTLEKLISANPETLLLRSGAALILPPVGPQLTAPLADPRADEDPQWQFPGAIFPIHVWLELRRARELVDPDLAGTKADPSEVVRVRTAVPPSRSDSAKDGGGASLAGFAAELEGAMKGVRVASGKVSTEEQEIAGTEVWAVAFTQGEIPSVALSPPLTVKGTTGKQPRAFALKPLSKSLISRSGVTTQRLAASGLLSTTTETRNYVGIELDVWARAFLADVETVLSSAYAPGARATKPTALSSILTAKQSVLAGAVAAGLDYVFEGEVGTDAGPRKDAVEALKQQLLLSVLRGYDAAAVLQYDATVTSPWTEKYARLSGAPVPVSDTEKSLGKVSLSNGKISLTSGKSHVNLVVTAPDVAAHAVVESPLRYRVVELEFDIAKDVTGYERSEWLTFVNEVPTNRDALKLDLGTPAIPFPLRAYPPVPAVLNHAAVPATNPKTLDEALRWAYKFEIRHQSVDQDEINLGVDLNEKPPAEGATGVAADDLFAALAEYNEISTDLMAILAELKDPTKSPAPDRLRNALQTFADQVGLVASAWERHWAPPRPDLAFGTEPDGGGAVQHESHRFVLKPLTDGSRYDRVRLIWTQGSEKGLEWPEINWVDETGARHWLNPVAASGTNPCDCPESSACRCYEFPNPLLGGPVARAFAPLTLELSFGNLHIASYQSARASVSVTRNSKLLGPSGAATTNGFVYQTPTVGFPDRVVPLIDVTKRFDIGMWSYVPASNPLVPLFEQIFNGDTTNRTVSVMTAYGYELVSGERDSETSFPVKLSPSFLYAQSRIDDLALALESWVGDHDPQPLGALWKFSVSMLSVVDPDLPRPILRLRNLTAPLAAPPQRTST